MEQAEAIAAFGALAQVTRLELYRLLVRQGAAGMSAGNIAERLGVAPSSLSFHLTSLVEAGLLTQTRAGRQFIYAVAPETIGELQKYLTGMTS
jgi:DNA-binding transcriptional ArsR family regulator